MQGTVIQVSISKGGVPKLAVSEVLLTPHGIQGDGHHHPQIHGGPRKAVLLVAQEAIDALREQGFPLYAGALGENLTTLGLEHRQMRVGQRFRVGEAFIELTKVRQPCDTLSVYGAGIQKAVYDADVKAGDARSPRWGLSGFYAAVIEPGVVRADDVIALADQAV